MAKLNQNQVAVFKRYLSRWNYSQEELSKSFAFRSGAEALDFLDFVVKKARELENSPEIHLVGQRVSLHLKTADEEGVGVTGRDFALAMAVEQWLNNRAVLEEMGVNG